MEMDLLRRSIFLDRNKGKDWKDRCNTCCVLKCGLFGDLKKQCHCDNFATKSCGECKYKDLQY